MESLQVTVPEIWAGQNRGGKKEKRKKKKEKNERRQSQKASPTGIANEEINKANWMVSNSEKLDPRTKQHTQFGVSASNGSRDMTRTKSWRKKKKKKNRSELDDKL